MHALATHMLWPVTYSGVVLLCQVVLQFGVNAITGNSINQATVWKLFFVEGFQVRTLAISTIFNLAAQKKQKKLTSTCYALLIAGRNCLSSAMSIERLSLSPSP